MALKSIVEDFVKQALQEEINKTKLLGKHAADISRIVSSHNARRLGVDDVADFTGGTMITAEETIWPTATKIEMKNSLIGKLAPYLLAGLAGLGGYGAATYINAPTSIEVPAEPQLDVPPVPNITLEVD